jgi:hypothetical protein
MKQLLKLKAVGLLVMLVSIGFVKAQSLTPVEPVRQGELADPSLDAAGYDAHKAQFVAEHPEQYNQLVGNQTKDQVTPTPWGNPDDKDRWVAEHPREYAEMMQPAADNRTRISRAEFDALPAVKQQAIKNDSKFLIVD